MVQKKGRTTKTKEKRNASDGGGDMREIEKTTVAKAGTNKESKKPKNIDPMT